MGGTKKLLAVVAGIFLGTGIEGSSLAFADDSPGDTKGLIGYTCSTPVHLQDCRDSGVNEALGYCPPMFRIYQIHGEEHQVVTTTSLGFLTSGHIERQAGGIVNITSMTNVFGWDFELEIQEDRELEDGQFGLLKVGESVPEELVCYIN